MCGAKYVFVLTEKAEKMKWITKTTAKTNIETTTYFFGFVAFKRYQVFTIH